MNIYQSYCYSSISDVKDQILSDPLIGDGWVVVSATTTTTSINVTAQKQNTTRTYTLSPPECTALGFQNSYSGLTLDDSVELSGLALVFLAVCFVGKQLRRSAS